MVVLTCPQCQATEIRSRWDADGEMNNVPLPQQHIQHSAESVRAHMQLARIPVINSRKVSRGRRRLLCRFLGLCADLDRSPYDLQGLFRTVWLLAAFGRMTRCNWDCNWISSGSEIAARPGAQRRIFDPCKRPVAVSAHCYLERGCGFSTFNCTCKLL